MSDRGYLHRKKWNSENYKQLNVAVSADLAEAFKLACQANGEPARQVVIRLMTGYISDTKPTMNRASAIPDYSTLENRRSALKQILLKLEDMRAAEEAYRDNIPINMYNKLEAASNAVDNYDVVMAALEELYSI